MDAPYTRSLYIFGEIFNSFMCISHIQIITKKSNNWLFIIVAVPYLLTRSSITPCYWPVSGKKSIKDFRINRVNKGNRSCLTWLWSDYFGPFIPIQQNTKTHAALLFDRMLFWRFQWACHIRIIKFLLQSLLHIITANESASGVLAAYAELNSAKTC